jgi:hypothetical protein
MRLAPVTLLLAKLSIGKIEGERSSGWSTYNDSTVHVSGIIVEPTNMADYCYLRNYVVPLRPALPYMHRSKQFRFEGGPPTLLPIALLSKKIDKNCR